MSVQKIMEMVAAKPGWNADFQLAIANITIDPIQNPKRYKKALRDCAAKTDPTQQYKGPRRIRK